MSSYICLDTSVLMKVLVEEEDSDKATVLMRRIIEERKIIVLPAFAWAEVGSVLRQKCKRGELSTPDADDLWAEFQQFPGIEYLNDNMVMGRAWELGKHFDMPTLYDAAFMAVAEIVTENTGETCEYWTTDERLVKIVSEQKEYVKWLKALPQAGECVGLKK
ncbi:type II toxin-antitoxin system VapC family toxin [Neomoorella mulderi]|uniref:PIN domain-containing protein n=1 Tax=Moorella mulderi DSM 14980 TaxID=1122241 RepID=A0A151AU74_9FIRM|nr:type II toxin-antitoxin system VapC family toxin [Moorella mulderi]KYH31188.1 hypothetical protein MOMUL_25690 [Moorella mulderi DSM 14980]